MMCDVIGETHCFAGTDYPGKVNINEDSAGGLSGSIL